QSSNAIPPSVENQMSLDDSHVRLQQAYKFFKRVVCNGNIIEAYIDTGSSASTMRSSTAVEFGFSITRDDQVKSVKLIGFGDNVTRPLGYFYATLQVDEVKAENVLIYVVP